MRSRNLLQISYNVYIVASSMNFCEPRFQHFVLLAIHVRSTNFIDCAKYVYALFAWSILRPSTN